jgi:DNA primase catalytic subunit
MENREVSAAEKKIRSITQMYYSRLDIQKAIFDFSKNREISPRYFEGFGKRPDSFGFKGDVFSMVKKGATSFHCSEEIWVDPMKIETGMSEREYNNLRIGWDLLIDIDCEKGMEYSILAAKAIVETFKQHGIKNMGIKFSGSKGFHLIVPWEAFPKEINGVKTSELFPELPRKIVAYIRHYSEPIIKNLLPEELLEKIGSLGLKEGVKCLRCKEIADSFERVELYCRSCRQSEIRKFEKGLERKQFFCAECKAPLMEVGKEDIFHCNNCNLTSSKLSSEDEQGDFNKERIEPDWFELMGLDLILVSPRHLFRMPYSLHEKTALCSVVLDEDELDDFQKEKHADPLRVKIKNFMPLATPNEAAELVMQALDWAKENKIGEERNIDAKGKYSEFKSLKLEKINESQFPPCVKKILEGMKDGKKRGLFVLINLFRSIGMEKEILEKKIYEWNEKNEVPLKKGYIHTQLVWSYKRKPIMPQNCKTFYQNLGVCSPDNLCSKIKNPVNYVVRKNFSENSNPKSGSKN